MKEKFEKFFSFGFKSAFLFLMGLMVFIFSMMTGNIYISKSINLFTILISLEILILIYWFSGKIINLKIRLLIPVIIFAAAAVPRVIIVFIFHSQPFNDFLTYYSAAKMWYSGNMSFLKDFTFANFPDSLGFVKYQSLLMSVLSDNIIAFQLFNCLITSAICIVIYVLLKKVSHLAAVTAAIIYALFPPNIIYPTILTNQHMSTLLFFIAFYLLTFNGSSRNLKNILIKTGAAGILIGLGNLIRPEALPFVLAITIILLLRLFFSFKSLPSISVKLVTALLPAVFLLFYFMTASAFGLYMRQYNVYSISGDLRYKIITGLSYDSQGFYRRDISSKFFSGDDNDKNEMLKDIAYYYKNSPYKIVTLEMTKMSYQYASKDTALLWSLGDKGQYGKEAVNFSYIQKTYEKLTVPFYFIIILLAAYGFWKRRRASLFNIETILALATLVRILVYFIIEVQERYRYLDIPIFFIFGALGMVYFMDNIKPRLKSFLFEK